MLLLFFIDCHILLVLIVVCIIIIIIIGPHPIHEMSSVKSSSGEKFLFGKNPMYFFKFTLVSIFYAFDILRPAVSDIFRQAKYSSSTTLKYLYICVYYCYSRVSLRICIFEHISVSTSNPCSPVITHLSTW